MNNIKDFKEKIEEQLNDILKSSFISPEQISKVRQLLLNSYDSDYDDRDLENILKEEICSDEN